MSELNRMTREELYQEVLRLRSCMTGEHGLADKVPTEIWLAYERRATDYAAMHGNGSAALKAGILRITLDAWLSGRMAPGVPSAWVVVYADGSRGLAYTADEADEAIAEAHAGAVREPLFALTPHPSSKLGDATQKTGQSAENAEGAGSSPVGPVSMWATVVRDTLTGEPVWRCNETDNRDGEHDEPVIELNPATFKLGTKIEVIEPIDEIDRILSLPDAEILEEVQARGEDPVAIADHYRAMVGAIAKKAGGLS